MFTLIDFFYLLLSALVILPLVSVIRESGYYLVVSLLGATNKKLTVGSGPVLFRTETIEVRRYFFMYSWFEYDEINPDKKFWHGLIYASPMLSNIIVAVLINSLIVGGIIPEWGFWNQFLFYVFYFVLFDALPVYLPDGQPSNGRAIFDLIWHGRRSDYSKSQQRDQEGRTQAQEETMRNRDKDERERGDHSRMRSRNSRRRR